MPLEPSTSGGGGDTAPSVVRTPLLETRGISKSFGAVQALTDVDFEVYPGEVVALVGDNGAGKSTLIKCLAGVHTADTGSILIDGTEVKISTPSEATHLGVETVYQDLALCDNLDVVANMFLGRERADPAGLGPLKELEMERKSLDVLESLHVTTIQSIRQVVASLSGGQRQSVAIARSVMWSARLVILDEPTAALGVAQSAQVHALVKRLREHGLGVVVITHNLQEVFELADRIIVLRLGRRVATFAPKSTSPEDVVAAITGARQEAA
jgi:D-xylose transport system ATP-binding protein